jgi:hypothetical protein
VDGRRRRGETSPAEVLIHEVPTRRVPIEASAPRQAAL